jgi:arginase
MNDQFILSPFFMDDPIPAMRVLAGEGWQINAPNVRGDSIMDRLSSLHRPLADRVSLALRAGRRPVVISGDCCNSIPVLAALQREQIEPALVWLDAHGDFNTFETSPSGYIFGMPLAMLCGLGDLRLTSAVGVRKLPADRVILVDGRDLDPGEHDLVVKHKIHWVRDIERVLIVLATELADRPIWVHFDTDILDAADQPESSPSMLYRVPNGPSLKRLIALAEAIAKTGRVVAVSVSMAIGADEADHTQTPGMRVLRALLGQ